MKKFLCLFLVAIFLTPHTSSLAAAGTLQVTQRESDGDLVMTAALPSTLVLKSDFQVTWKYKIKFVTAEGYVGDFGTEQKIVKTNLRSAEYFFYLPLNGLYKISLDAEIRNGGVKENFVFSTDYKLNNPKRYTISSIPENAIPSIVVPEPLNGDELVQIQIGANHGIAGTDSLSGYRLADYVRLVNDSRNRFYSDSSYSICNETRELVCASGAVQGVTLISVPKEYYLSHRIYHSQEWTIKIYNPANDSRIFSFRFGIQGEITIPVWESDRSKAPDAKQSTPGLDCPYSFNGNILKCIIKPANEFSMPKGSPIWVETQLFIDGSPQKKYLKTFKTQIGTKTNFTLQLPANYRNLKLVATTLGIGGDSDEQSWTVTKPITAAQKQKSYKAGYGSVMISSQDNLKASGFYSMATGADGRVVRSKASIWCQQALQNQIYRGATFSSSSEWVRGCTDAAMKL
jgi:hypothetical protein